MWPATSTNSIGCGGAVCFLFSQLFWLKLEICLCKIATVVRVAKNLVSETNSQNSFGANSDLMVSTMLLYKLGIYGCTIQQSYFSKKNLGVKNDMHFWGEFHVEFPHVEKPYAHFHSTYTPATTLKWLVYPVRPPLGKLWLGSLILSYQQKVEALHSTSMYIILLQMMNSTPGWWL